MVFLLRTPAQCRFELSIFLDLFLYLNLFFEGRTTVYRIPFHRPSCYPFGWYHILYKGGMGRMTYHKKAIFVVCRSIEGCSIELYSMESPTIEPHSIVGPSP